MATAIGLILDVLVVARGACVRRSVLGFLYRLFLKFLLLLLLFARFKTFFTECFWCDYFHVPVLA